MTDVNPETDSRRLLAPAEIAAVLPEVERRAALIAEAKESAERYEMLVAEQDARIGRMVSAFTGNAGSVLNVRTLEVLSPQPIRPVESVPDGATGAS